VFLDDDARCSGAPLVRSALWIALAISRSDYCGGTFFMTGSLTPREEHDLIGRTETAPQIQLLRTELDSIFAGR